MNSKHTIKILNTVVDYPTEARVILDSLGKVDYRRPSQKELLEIIVWLPRLAREGGLAVVEVAPVPPFG